MRTIKRAVYGAVVGSLAVPSLGIAQSGTDPNWAEKLAPARSRYVAPAVASPYNPVPVQQGYVDSPAIVRTGFFDGSGFKSTSVPGLKMMFQGDSGYQAFRPDSSRPQGAAQLQPLPSYANQSSTTIPLNPVPVTALPMPSVVMPLTPQSVPVQSMPVPQGIPAPQYMPVPQSTSVPQYMPTPQYGTAAAPQGPAMSQPAMTQLPMPTPSYSPPPAYTQTPNYAVPQGQSMTPLPMPSTVTVPQQQGIVVMPQQGSTMMPQGMMPQGMMPQQGSAMMPQQGTIVMGEGYPVPGTSYPQGGSFIQNPDGSYMQSGTVQQGVVGMQGGAVQKGTLRQNMPQLGLIGKGKPTFLQEVMGTGDSSCNIPCACGPAGRFWISGEYSWVWNKGMTIPPLVTTSPAGTAQAVAGTLGAAGTRVLYGKSNILNEGQSGFRLRAGFWFDAENRYGIDASGIYNPSRSESFLAANTTGNPGLFRPYFDPVSGQPASQLVAFQDPTGAPILGGAIRVNSTSDFSTGDLNFRRNLACGPCSRLDLLLGYRYLRLREGVEIREDLQATDPNNVAAPFGTTIVVGDNFRTTNTFHGGQVGVTGENRFGKFVLGYTAKVAAGNMHSETEISGATTSTIPGMARVVGSGGLLASPSNIGNYSKDRFAYVPEVGFTVGYQFTPQLRAFAGYNFLYASTLQRPGDQIDIGVNTSQLPPGTLSGVARPVYLNRTVEYWQQSVSAGVELRF